MLMKHVKKLLKSEYHPNTFRFKPYSGHEAYTMVEMDCVLKEILPGKLLDLQVLLWQQLLGPLSTLDPGIYCKNLLFYLEL